MTTEEMSAEVISSTMKEKSKKKKRSKEESAQQGSPHKKSKKMVTDKDNVNLSRNTAEISDNTHSASPITNTEKKKKRSKEEVVQTDERSQSKESKKIEPENNSSYDDNKQTTETKDKTLSAEDAKEAVREKKREKRRKKKEAKQKQKLISQGKSGDEKTEVAKTESISYLHKWKKNKDEWSFQKVRQVWLLQNMYKPEMITDEDFSIVLEYMSGMKGKAREVTVEKAETIMKETEDSDSEKEGKTDSSETAKKAERARDVIQLLA